jgi:CO/xanthine dehydrogenase FAD-binding subunit
VERPEWCKPSSLSEALAQLAEAPEDSKVLAGGQSLAVMLRSRLLRPRRLVYLGALPELQEIRESGGRLTIGAMVTDRRLETDPQVGRAVPLLAEAAGRIASVHIRNLGTIGGNLCHALIGADLPPALLALDARLQVARRGGRRTVPVDQFFRGVMETALEPDEVLTHIELSPAGPPEWGTAYEKLAVRTVDPAIVGVAVALQLDERGRVRQVRIGIGGAGEVPVRARRLEAALLGATRAEVGEWAAVGVEEVECIDDSHASAWYRRRMVPVVAKRAILRAWDNLEGQAGEGRERYGA